MARPRSTITSGFSPMRRAPSAHAAGARRNPVRRRTRGEGQSTPREALAPPLHGSRVVELGCGTGRNRDFFLAAGAREYLGIDDSEGMLARAKRRPADARARWLAADVRRGLPEEVRGFDVVFI